MKAYYRVLGVLGADAVIGKYGVRAKLLDPFLSEKFDKSVPLALGTPGVPGSKPS
jgi:hypothetical protein